MTTGIDLSTLLIKPFESSDEKVKKYNGLTFKIIRELEVGKEVDVSVAPIFEIEFEDGNKVQAFPDEILTDVSIESIFTPEFLRKYRPDEYQYWEADMRALQNDIQETKDQIEEIKARFKHRHSQERRD